MMMDSNEKTWGWIDSMIAFKNIDKERYMGKWVAIYNGLIVFAGDNEREVINSFYSAFGNEPVYIDQVGVPKREIFVYTNQPTSQEGGE